MPNLTPKKMLPEDYRSPQSCEWMKGDQLSYMKQSIIRSEEIRKQRKMWERPADKLANKARYSGESTICSKMREE